jgi:hypothetical protein
MNGIGVGLTFLGLGLGAQETVSNVELLKVITEQNKKIEALTQRVQEMEGKAAAAPGAADSSQLKKGLMETNEALAETNKKIETIGNRLTLGKGIDGLKLTGDLRVRYEQRNRELEGKDDVAKGDGDRTRFRSRLRAGGIWTNTTEDWEVGAGLATGEKNDDRSTNDTWGHDSYIFEKGNVYLDYAYAKHTWVDPFESETLPGPLSLTLGQQRNPLVSTIMMWDSDINPAGFTAQYGDPKGKEYTGMFLTLGAYVLSNLSTGQTIGGANQENWDDSAWLYASQLGYAYKSESFDALGAIGYQQVSNTYRNIASATWATSNSNNPNTAWGGVDSGYEYRVVDAYGEVKTTFAGIEVKPYAHLAMNFGAEGKKTQARNNASGESNPDGDDFAGMLGFDLKRGKWSLGYGYAYIEADAVFGPARDSDFGETAGLQDTDIQGHVLKLGYSPTKNVTIGASLFMLDRINNVVASEANASQLLQLDAVYKF